jgi:hypothetical protein
MQLRERLSGFIVERRAEVRRSVLIEALVEADGREIRAIMLDVSRGGAMLAAADGPETGAEIRVLVDKAVIAGNVIWAEGYRFGISFERPLSQGRFDELVEHARYDGRAR